MASMREERVRRMLTIRKLAEAAGVSPATIHLSEVGQRLPRFGTMHKIAAALEVRAEHIDEFRTALEIAAKRKQTP